MIDTHAHVHAKAFDSDRAAVLERAFAAGVRYLLEVNIDVEGRDAARRLPEGDERIFGSVGIHPHDVARATVEELDRMMEELADPRVVAVGETGLDYYRDYAPHDRQREFFARQVAHAREVRKPLIVHARQKPDGPSAHEDVLRILETEGRGEVRGVLHCFSGDLEIARRAHTIGFRLGLGGAITYAPKKSAPLLASIAEACGPDIFVLETDCPYLTPHPRRNDRNEPANLVAVREALAAYLAWTPEEVDARTDRSALELFGLEHPMRPPQG